MVCFVLEYLNEAGFAQFVMVLGPLDQGPLCLTDCAKGWRHFGGLLGSTKSVRGVHNVEYQGK